MLGTVNLPLFIASGLLLNITPGADILYITSQSAARGTRAGVIAALGIGAGGMVHILFATFGLSALLATSAVAFTMVKLAGAAYLVYLGITTLLSLRSTHPEGMPAAATPAMRSHGRIFRQAVLVNTLNPKVALFFLAFLPQFVAPGTANPAVAFLFLGCLFNLNGTIVNILFAIGAAQIAGNVRRLEFPARIAKTSVGALFVWLGIRLALTAQN